MSECVAAPLIVLALYLLDEEAKRSTGRRLFAAGCVLGLATVLRLQLAPVLALVLLWRAIEDLRRRLRLKKELPLLAGIVLTLAAAGLLDAMTWNYPFQSLWLNFAYNALYGAADSFGREPWQFYLAGLIDHWRWYFPALFVLAALGGWRMKLPLAAALVIIAVHSLVPHKEYRFIYPAVLLILILAGMGLAQLASSLGALLARSQRRVALATLAGVAIVSALFASSAGMRPMWQSGHDLVEAAGFVSTLDPVCGIAADGTYGGYAYFHRDVPFYWLRDDAEMTRAFPGFDVLLTTKTAPPGFETLRCFGAVCVTRRPGACAPVAPRPPLRAPPVAAAAAG